MERALQLGRRSRSLHRAGLIGPRATTLSAAASRNNFASLYASLSVTIGAVGRSYAGWIDGVDSSPNAAGDAGRGISDRNAHYNWLAGASTVPLSTAAQMIGQRMNKLSTVPTIPRLVFAKLYADLSVILAKCAVPGSAGTKVLEAGRSCHPKGRLACQRESLKSSTHRIRVGSRAYPVRAAQWEMYRCFAT